ncbi:DUF790 family protein [Polyangium aurulentum]|uniref:DUF790 family protein n=1 Tax=Polyangium aurulentum TaxID=2567896 RepID=UPI0010ADE283|nr:DUF790 family protein [Polyangium aurulentum]UQA55055.1 DUF790 family protein [Polyangium aurulentum]
MLTSDLIRVKKRAKRLRAGYLRGDEAARILPIAQDFVAVLSNAAGMAREEVDDALDAVPVPQDLRTIALGLRKVLEGRCAYEVPEGIEPEAVRREVFLAAAAAHKALDVRGELDRAAVLAEVAPKLGLSPEAIDAALYADLRDNEILRAFRPIAAEALLERYDLALAQSILLRATKVVVRVSGEGSDRYRRLFRAARFHGLIHVVEGTPEAGYTITLDGPFSLFDAVQKYGLRLAMFLPAILACRDFHVRAEVLWGRTRVPAGFEIEPEDGLVSHQPELPSAAPDLESFRAAFERLGSEWTVSENERIFALPGEVVCVPDLVFRSAETGEEVFLEAFGFWSRSAVWQRVELIRKGFPARILLAVGKHLRVSEEVLGEEEAGEIYVYRAAMSPRAVLERLRKKG